MKEVICIFSKRCKAGMRHCGHSVPHKEFTDCTKSAYCGNWPDKPDFKPRVKCVDIEKFKKSWKCSECGEDSVSECKECNAIFCKKCSEENQGICPYHGTPILRDI